MRASALTAYLKKYLYFGIGAYASLFVIAYLLNPLPPTTVFTHHELRFEHFGAIVLFSTIWCAIMIAIYFFLARKIQTNLSEVFLHMGTIAMLGPLCEVAINTFCRLLFGSPLWVYHFFPVHGGDTSGYSFFVWAMYGCHLYFMDKKFIHSSAAYRSVVFALILSVDAIILEFILNVTSIYYLHTYIFYYLPNDVHHLTTIAVVPFYFIGGILAAEVIRRSFRYPALIGAMGFLIGFVFTFSYKFF